MSMQRQVLTRVVGLIGVSCVAVAAFVWLYKHSADINAAQHDRILALTEQVRQMDSQWNADVLRSATEVNRDYDALTTPLTEWPKLRRALVEELGSLNTPQSDKALKKIDAEFESKAELVSRFKSQNSVLKNSLRYLPTAQAEIADVLASERARAVSANLGASNMLSKVESALAVSADKDVGPTIALSQARAALVEVRSGLYGAARRSGAVQSAFAMSATDASIGALVSNALRYNLSPEAALGEALRAQNIAIRNGTSNMASGLRAAIQTLTNHVDVVLRERSAVAELLATINTSQIPTSVDGLVSAVNTGFAQHVTEQATYTKWFQWYVALLLVCLLLGAAALVRQWIRMSGSVKTSKEEVALANLRLVQADRMATIGQLSANLAHEINTPLASACSALDMLNEMLRANILPLVDKVHARETAAASEIAKVFKDEIEQDFVSCLTDGASSLAHIRSVIQNHRDFARVDHGNVSTVQIETQIDATLGMMGSVIKGRAIEVVKRFGKTVPITCNVTSINQVLLNIAKNAAEAMPNGGELTVETRMTSDNQRIIVTIADTGIGMSDETAKRIFEANFSTKTDGLGIGLAISLDLVRQHGGEIRVKSALNEGSVFALLLPVGIQPSLAASHELAKAA